MNLFEVKKLKYINKNNTLPRISAFLCALILFALPLTNVRAASYAPSSWAAEYVRLAKSYGIIPAGSSDTPYNQNIKRLEFCRIAVSYHNSLTGSKTPSYTASVFTDTDDPSVQYAAELGIITGRGNKIFSPDDAITRQEMSVMLTRLLSSCSLNVSVSGADTVNELSAYTDADRLQSWAVTSMVFCLKNGIIKGMSSTELWPEYHTTREQAITTIYRCFDKYVPDIKKRELYSPLPTADGDYNNMTCTVTGDAQLVSYKDRTLCISFNAAGDAKKYEADIYLDKSNFWYSEKDVYVKTVSSDTNSITVENMRTDKKYKIIIRPDAGNNITSYAYAPPLYTLEEKEKIVFGDGEINSKEDADASMESIEVDVWRINALGVKTASKAWLTVHKSIASVTKSVFREIFENKEQFPIKDAGAYAWRETMSSGRYSHHNYGTAIDINYNENYCLYKDGSFIGQFWLPHENALSIAPDSAVVSIFSKYGFVWGGDEWSNPKDYMHFSYLEL